MSRAGSAYHCQSGAVQGITSAADLHGRAEQSEFLAIFSFVDRIHFFSILQSLALGDKPHAWSHYQTKTQHPYNQLTHHHETSSWLLGGRRHKRKRCGRNEIPTCQDDNTYTQSIAQGLHEDHQFEPARGLSDVGGVTEKSSQVGKVLPSSAYRLKHCSSGELTGRITVGVVESSKHNCRWYEDNLCVSDCLLCSCGSRCEALCRDHPSVQITSNCCQNGASATLHG